MSSSKGLKGRELLPISEGNGSQTEVEISNNELQVFLMSQKPVVLSFPQRIASVTAKEILDRVYQELCKEKKLKFDAKYKNMFAIWVTSAYLELQLQPHHKPFNILANWDSHLIKHGPIELIEDQELIEKDEPTLDFQRNVFSDKLQEIGIELSDMGALRLLYLEAKLNVLDGRYPTDNYEKLAAIQAAIDLGPFDKSKHTIEYFRQHLNEYIPCNYIKTNDNNGFNGLIRTLSRNSQSTRCAQKITKQFEEISKSETTEYKLLRKYMEICWFIPCYGSAYFSAQIERRTKSGFGSLMNHFDLKVWVAINRDGVHVIAKETSEPLLSVEYNKLCWAIGCPKDNTNPDCIPCLFIQIPDNSNNNNILQIFSRQIKLIESLLNSFIEAADKTDNSFNHNICQYDCTDGSQTSETVSSLGSNSGHSYGGSHGSVSPCNTKKLSFATFDNSGHCIDKTGSWVRKQTHKQIIK